MDSERPLLQANIREALTEAREALPKVDEPEFVYCHMRGDRLRVLVEAVEGMAVQPEPEQSDSRCPDCFGSEFVGYKRGVRCSTCNGTGLIG